MPEDVFEINLDENLREIEQIFGNLHKEAYNVERKAVAAGSRVIGQEVRRSYKQYFQNKSGQHPDKPFKDPKNLRSSVRVKQYKKPKLGAYITSTVHAYNPYSPDQPKVLYGIALGKGYTIQPKDPDKYLTFQVDGKWVKRKEVKVDARPWITDPGTRAANSTQVQRAMETAVQKELEKLADNPNYRVKEENYR